MFYFVTLRGKINLGPLPQNKGDSLTTRVPSSSAIKASGYSWLRHQNFASRANNPANYTGWSGYCMEGRRLESHL